MSKNIIWSSQAEKDLITILEYLDLHWYKEVTITFLDILDQKVIKIAGQPELFPYFDKNHNIRKCVVTKHNTLYFREETSEIQVLRIYDVRQHPDKLHF
ncbi:hypothetical protein AM493_20220 [Flavobacterium akiainvivens]|uniref:Plasmid stabilization protein n=1 Tax=Flavobacterium akiainvivens TaxID=1202724 RepID=A0A0M8MKL2_9FLAO|nr:type II toxin-antitoxin system RelE/ParE family toxin [Flavobacterium akiainvivens]KOS08111.1 hypothetical protein AM493_20220 [Flavobacterium akiainvivens]SFQ72000.1 Plasmid stabilization system protein ParE [Flavobacterium akiainvivens]